MAYITENVEVLNEKCRECPDLEIESRSNTALFADDHMVVIDRVTRCSHLELCRRLYNRYQEAKKTDTGESQQ